MGTSQDISQGMCVLLGAPGLPVPSLSSLCEQADLTHPASPFGVWASRSQGLQLKIFFFPSPRGIVLAPLWNLHFAGVWGISGFFCRSVFPFCDGGSLKNPLGMSLTDLDPGMHSDCHTGFGVDSLTGNADPGQLFVYLSLRLLTHKPSPAWQKWHGPHMVALVSHGMV